MKYFRLIAEDENYSNWFFFDASKPRRQVRDLYQDFVCPSCNRVDEDKALSCGVSPDLRISSRHDYLVTNDWVYCVSVRLKNVLELYSIKGFEYLELPNTSSHLVVVSTIPVKVDIHSSGIKYEGPVCQLCKRYNWSGEGPFFQSLEVPDDVRTVFRPEIWNEHAYSRRCCLYCSELIADILQGAEATGMIMKYVGEV
jgi:hypothetical protein